MNAYHNALFQFLTRDHYKAIRFEEHVYFRKEQENQVLLLRIIPEQLPGSAPVDYPAEHALMEQLRNNLMVMTGSKVETLMVSILTDSPNHLQVEEASSYENLWFLNRKNSRIYIYENQITDFYGFEDKLERFTQNWNKADNMNQRKQLHNTFTPVNTVMVVLCVLVFLLLNLFGDTQDAGFIADHGGMVYLKVTNAGEYWRMLTSMFIHFDMQHLGENMLVLILTGRILERVMGKGRYLIIYFVSGLVSSFASLQFTLQFEPYSVSAGASGAICGVLGGILFLILENTLRKKKRNVEGLSLGGMIFMIGIVLGYGFMVNGVDNAAHIGGLIAGFLMTALLELPSLLKSRG